MINALWSFILSPWGRAICGAVAWVSSMALATAMFRAAWILLLQGWLFGAGLGVALGISLIVKGECLWPSK